MFDTKLQSEEFKFYFLFFLAITFLFSMLMPFSYVDLAVWIAEGRQIFRQGTLYIHDAYSFNPTTALPYPWLASLIYYFLDANFSIEFIFFLHRVIPVAIVAYWLIRYPQLLHKNNWLPLVIGISGLSMLIVDRPALLVLLLIPIAFEMIESDWHLKNKIKVLAFLVLWTNLHGSFLLFLVFLAYRICIQIVFEQNHNHLKKQLSFFCLSILATLVNPWGIKIYSYVIQTAAVSKIRMSEWQPPAFFEKGEFSFEMLLFVVTLSLLVFTAYRNKKLKILFTSSLFIFIVSSFIAGRNLPLLFAVLPLFWGKNLTHVKNVIGLALKPTFPKILVNRTIVIILIFGGFFMFSSFSENFRKNLPGRYAKKYDHSATFRISDYLNQFTDKRVFNSWLVGSFLIYSQPNQIFIDTRNIIYSDSIFDGYISASNNINGASEAFLNQHQIDYVVSAKTKALATVLQMSHNWTFIMEDNGYSLFERK